MFTRRRILLLATCCVLLACGMFFALSPLEKEPSYQGRRLSEWLFCHDGHYVFGNPDLTPEAADAVRHIGTNAIPLLLTWIRAEPSKKNQFCDSLIRKMPPLLQTRLYEMTGHNERERRPNCAMVGFKALGTNASSEIPELASLLKSKNGTVAAFHARFALAYLGKDALPPLLDVLAQPPNWDQMNIAMAISAISQMSYLGTNALPAVPLIIHSVNNLHAGVQVASVGALGSLALAPELAIPVLTNQLKSSDATLRSMAARSLGCFGVQAKPVAPLLIEMFQDHDRDVRTSAYLAVRQCASELLTNKWGNLPSNAIPTDLFQNPVTLGPP